MLEQLQVYIIIYYCVTNGVPYTSIMTWINHGNTGHMKHCLWLAPLRSLNNITDWGSEASQLYTSGKEATTLS